VVSIWKKPTRLCFVAYGLMVVQAATFAQPADRTEEALAAKSHLARQALLDKRYQEAAALYRELLQALPDNVGLRLNLAIALDKAGQPSAAIPEIQRVTRATPSSAPAWLLLGLAYQQLNQPGNAIPPLRQALRLDPANHSALLELADAELITGDTRGAARDFASLAAAEPEQPKAWEGCGRAYLSLSETSFELLKTRAPDSPYFLSLVARSRSSADQFGDALSLYADALKMQPDLPGLHAARAEIYRQTGHNDWAAIEEDRESHIRRPDCARQAAACAYLAGNWQRTLAASGESKLPVNLYWTAMACSHLAEESFKKLAALPQSPELHAVLADSYQRMGRRLDAIAEWRKAVELSPSDRLFQARLAETLVRARVYPEAEGLLVNLVAQQPDNGEWQYLLGNLLLQVKRDDEALPHLIVATTQMPDLLPAQEALGRVYLDLGKPADAVVHLEKARALDDGSISFALSSAYRQLGRLEDARAALARYQVLAKQRSAAGSAGNEAPITAP
jgi:predicted Zn-dependent protease